MRRAQAHVVTVAVNAFQFKMPVFVGDLISCYAQVKRVGTTSLTVDVEVYAERGLGHAGDPEKCVKVTEATLTYVAIDGQRRKRPVPPRQANNAPCWTLVPRYLKSNEGKRQSILRI